jgi:signal transduction histidine kinase
MQMRSTAGFKYLLIFPVAIALLAAFNAFVVVIPNQPGVLLLAVAYAAYRGGLIVGLVAAVMHVLFTAIFFSDAPLFLAYSRDNLVRVAVISFVAPGMATMIGLLRHASDDLLERLKRSEAALKLLNSDLERRVEERTAALAAEAKKRSDAEARLLEGQKLQAIGQLAGGIAHDLNNMLSVIMSSQEVLLDTLPDASDHRRTMVTHSIEAAEKGGALTRALLAFARKQPLQPQIIDANALLRGIIFLLRRTLGEPIEVDLRLDHNLWPCLIDRAQLENAILNLAINARDAMPSGGRLTITSANAVLTEQSEGENDAALNGSYVMIEVADTGVGMPPEILRRAFEPFFTTKEFGKGTGLGLSMVYGFARQSGGMARISSEVGGGTGVRLYLPRAEGVATEQPATSSEPARHGSGEKILVVEDNSSLALVTTEMLIALRYRAVMVSDGPSALIELERTKDIALLLTDIVLPRGMSGIELATAARQLRPDMPVIFVSGFFNHASVPGYFPNETTLLTKPVRSAQLAEAIADALAQVAGAPASGAPALTGAQSSVESAN